MLFCKLLKIIHMYMYVFINSVLAKKVFSKTRDLWIFRLFSQKIRSKVEAFYLWSRFEKISGEKKRSAHRSVVHFPAET